jgi:16S rRNA (adenine1518-N6/adenine1519-N6)-dimethyltransferase
VQTLAEIRAMLEARGLAPRKRHGQNFLTDHNLIRRLVDAADVGPGSLVLEVGPGTGALTDELLHRGCEVVACEIDPGLAALIRERYQGRPLTLIEGDCLAGKRTLSPGIVAALRGRRFTLVANLPYGAATPLMAALLAQPSCLGQFVTIQKEVADRLVATPSTKAYGGLTVLAQTLARVERLAVLPPECFWPRPEVTSAMVALRPVTPSGIDDPAAFAAFCQEVFTGRRKQLGTTMREAIARTGLPEGVAATDRAESLSPSQLAAVFLRLRAR